jgi:hypothetical protein
LFVCDEWREQITENSRERLEPADLLASASGRVTCGPGSSAPGSLVAVLATISFFT